MARELRVNIGEPFIIRLRSNFCGTVVMNRGDRREPIFRDDEDQWNSNDETRELNSAEMTGRRGLLDLRQVKLQSRQD